MTCTCGQKWYGTLAQGFGTRKTIWESLSRRMFFDGEVMIGVLPLLVTSMPRIMSGRLNTPLLEAVRTSTPCSSARTRLAPL